MSNAEAKTEEVERMCKGSMMNDSVVTANEAGGWRRRRPVLRTVSEDDDHIAFYNDHVEHDMNDGPNENSKMMRNQRKLKHIHRNHAVCRRGDCRRDR